MLLFADGLPVALVLLTIVMDRRFGLDNTTITTYTALLALPWVLRPLADMLLTRVAATPKVWVVVSEMLMAVALCGVAYTLPSSQWRTSAIGLLLLVSVLGSLHTAAVERYYLSDGALWYSGRAGVVRIMAVGASLMAGLGAMAMVAGNMEVLRRNIPYSWSFMCYLYAVLFGMTFLYHLVLLPSSPPDREERDARCVLTLRTASYIVRRRMWEPAGRPRLVFLLLFLLCWGLHSVVSVLFLIDAAHNGGCGLSPQELGLVLGTVSVAVTLLGSVAGTRWLRCSRRLRDVYLMSFSVSVPCVACCCMSVIVPMSLPEVCLFLLAAYLCLGFGLSGYMTSLKTFCRGRLPMQERVLSLSATAFSLVLSVFVSGFLQELLGYVSFFFIVLAVGVLAAACVIVTLPLSLSQSDKVSLGDGR